MRTETLACARGQAADLLKQEARGDEDGGGVKPEELAQNALGLKRKADEIPQFDGAGDAPAAAHKKAAMAADASERVAHRQIPQQDGEEDDEEDDDIDDELLGYEP